MGQTLYQTSSPLLQTHLLLQPMTFASPSQGNACQAVSAMLEKEVSSRTLPSYILFPPLKLLFPFTGTRALELCAPCSVGKDFVDPVLWQKYSTHSVWARINMKQLT